MKNKNLSLATKRTETDINDIANTSIELIRDLIVEIESLENEIFEFEERIENLEDELNEYRLSK